MTSSDHAAPNHHANSAMTLTAAALLGVFVATCAGLRDTSIHVRLFQLAYAIGFVGYGLLAFCVHKDVLAGRWSIWLVGCVLARLALFHTVPSDDIYRYVWEGRIQLAGHNPYAIAPDDPTLAPLRDSDWHHINHPDYTAIYPPLAQLLFRTIARVSPTLYGYKAVIVAFDALAVILLAATLRQLNKPPHLSLLYALCPLTLSAFAIEGHVDGMLMALLAAALYTHVTGRLYFCAGFIAMATLTKTVPVLLFPWLWRHNIRACGLALLVTAAGYAYYADAGWKVFDSLIRFASETQLLGFGHACLSTCFDPQSARWLGAATIAGVAVWQAWRRAPLPYYMFALFAATILLMPVVHFWYLTWILLVLPFNPRASWYILAASMVFYFEAAYIRATQGHWLMPWWAPYLVYTPFVIAWIIEFGIGFARHQRGDSGISTDLR